jgi:taurine dioxygenase
MQIERLGVSMGAAVSGLDLRAHWSESQHLEIVHALYSHQVLVFPKQCLEGREQVEVASRFGEVQPAEPHRFLGESSPFQVVKRSRDKRPTGDRWHTDIPIMENPPMVGVLAAELVPSLGGDTLWTSMYGLYNSLSDPLRFFCERLVAEHVIDPALGYVRTQYGDAVAQTVADRFPPRLHPLVQIHPYTKRKHLYLGGPWTNRLPQLTERESQLFLTYLERAFDDPTIQLRWGWSQGDVALWDLRSTVHKGLSDHWEAEPDRIVRTIFVGEGIDTVPMAPRPSYATN